MPKRLTNLRVSEISLVDRPANPGARVLLHKRAAEAVPYSPRKDKLGAVIADALRKMGIAKADADASARDFDAVLEGIEAREYAAGCMDEIEEAVCALRCSVQEIMCDDAISDKGSAVATSFKQFREHMTTVLPEELEKSALAIAKALSAGQPGFTSEAYMKELAKALGLPETATEADIAKAMGAIVTKLGAASNDIVLLKRENAVLKMSAKHSAFMNNAGAKMPTGGKDAFADMTSDERDAHMEKHPVEKVAKSAEQVRIEKLEADQAADRATIAKMQDEKAVEEVAKRIQVWGGSPENAATLHALAKSDKAGAEKLEQTMKGLAEQAKAGGVFKEFGSRQQTEGTAKGAVEARVTEMRKSDPKIKTDASALLKLSESRDPKDQELWKRYREETQGQRAA